MKRFIIPFSLFVLIVSLNCRSKEYIVPSPKGSGLLTVKNSIFLGGFYVKIDNKEAGFFSEEFNIPLKPGKHKIEVFNRETVCKEKVQTIKHKFKYKIKIEKGENRIITLSFKDKAYTKKILSASERKEFRGKEESKKKRGFE
ncbi:MAG: hypothetical protein SV062_07120 [Thermodesulfobacteriota bacterium]|nr:hypothetical protein [Thermodesulfobacteriota bacterium]